MILRLPHFLDDILGKNSGPVLGYVQYKEREREREREI
jgi:hypothetical protein